VSTHPSLWLGFNAFVLLMLGLDLGVFHRRNHTVRVREALAWTGVWVVLALIFNAGVWHFRGEEAGLQFLAGYLIEKSLSVDNLFVFLIVFSAFQVPAAYQHKVLFWGVLGALIMRGGLIVAGSALLQRFHWTIYLFGGFLVLTGIKLLLQKDEAPKLENNMAVKLARRWVPMTPTYVGGRFFVREAGRRLATPLFLVLVTIEFTDLVFALDSIPAIFAVTPDPFIVYSSNVFALLGLRSLFFALAGVMTLFSRLKTGLALILAFVGVKMLIVDWVVIPIGASLGVIGGILALSVAASLIWPARSAISSSEPRTSTTASLRRSSSAEPSEP
jgi:tellurite resistance protein TerC